MGSAAESEIGTCYINARELLPIHVCEEEIGHPQGPIPVQFDNTTAVGFTKKTTKQNISKSIYMRFYWLQNRKDQGKLVKTTLMIITENIILILITN